MCGKLPNVAAINQIFILVVVAGAIATVFFFLLFSNLPLNKKYGKTKKGLFLLLNEKQKTFFPLKNKTNTKKYNKL